MKTQRGCLCIALTAVTVLFAGCDAGSSQVDLPDATVWAPKSDVAIATFCSACHPLPNPESFTRDRWRNEVQLGINLYRKSQRTDLIIPDFEATVAWFEEHAPDQLAYEVFDAATDDHGSLRPIDVPIQVVGGDARLTAVAHAEVLSGDGEPPRLLLSDLRTGHLWQATQQEDSGLRLETMGRVANPAHCEPTDLDADGQPDYLVADLGGFFPSQDRRGSLWWFRPAPDGGFSRVALRMGMMRVSDVRAGDFDADGDLDLVVAEFGMHFRGGIHLLLNQGMDQGVPQFQTRTVDERSGGIHVPVVDLDRDGDLDFVALLSQHHEAVVAFLNDGQGHFHKETIFQAGDPAYGSSGIELVDMDGDDDLDVLLSNGDTFDDAIPKPSHSIQWLENRGVYPYQHHRIGALPGAYRAVAGDVDADGDVDVAAVALLVEASLQKQPADTFDGVVLFEQVAAGQFARHRLQTTPCRAATCQLMDWDQDGDLDLVAFPFCTDAGAFDSLTVFQNDRQH